MEESEKGSPRREGCALIAVAVVAVIVGAGLWLGRVSEESKSPCERYAETVVRALNSCHSGLNRDTAHHVAVCEKSVDPTPACLKRIEELSCDQLKRGLTAADDACKKKETP